MSPDLFVVLKLIVLVFALIVSPYPWTGMHRRVHSSKASTFHIIINSGQSQPVVREQTGIVIWVLYSAEQSCVNIENPCVWPCVSRQASCRCVFEPDTKPALFFYWLIWWLKKQKTKNPLSIYMLKKKKKKKKKNLKYFPIWEVTAQSCGHAEQCVFYTLKTHWGCIWSNHCNHHIQVVCATFVHILVAHVSWAPLKDRILNWRPPQNNMKKPQQMLRDFHVVH